MNYLDVAINQIIREQGIPHEWNSLIKDELKNLNIKNGLDRKNLTDIPFVTIDGEDAKDFDDAVFCSVKKSSYTLKVAIADVASVVLPNTELDKEAFRRGTSIYFPSTVIPMLPEIISNNICSLVPNENRNVLVTYNEIENNKIKESNIFDSIESLKKLTNILLQNKTQRNALEIESTEPYINIDDVGNILDISTPKRLFAHQMIEESMIAANICAAKFLKKHYGFGVYRVHEEPESLKIENLKKFFSLKGHSNKKNLSTLNLINSLIGHANKDENNKLLNILILQSLKRAQYSSKQIGHFGLQLKEYSHFTSPIRRYPDLLVHRMIKTILNNSNNDYKQENI